MGQLHAGGCTEGERDGQESSGSSPDGDDDPGRLLQSGARAGLGMDEQGTCCGLLWTQNQRGRHFLRSLGDFWGQL